MALPGFGGAVAGAVRVDPPNSGGAPVEPEGAAAGVVRKTGGAPAGGPARNGGLPLNAVAVGLPPPRREAPA